MANNVKYFKLDDLNLIYEVNEKHIYFNVAF